MLDHTEDSAMQLQRLTQVTNERDMLNEKLKLVGNEWNEAIVRIYEAKKTKDPEKILNAQIEAQRIEGKFKEIKADIKCKQDIISTIKYLVKMEKF